MAGLNVPGPGCRSPYPNFRCAHGRQDRPWAASFSRPLRTRLPGMIPGMTPPKFSDRIGATRPSTSLQIDSISDELRHSIWNLLLHVIGDDWPSAARFFAEFFFKVPAHELPADLHSSRHWVFQRYSGMSKWHEPYNLLEFLVEYVGLLTTNRWQQDQIVAQANQILERELSGYRFVAGVLTRLTEAEEVAAIEEAVSNADHLGLGLVKDHLKQALKCLGRKPDPDYRNSIKESISAVEATVKLITGKRGGGLDKALNVLAAKTGMHPVLEAGLSKLYGYTSDASGIRHAMLKEPTVDYDDAKFMLVSCSAFVNFLIGKADKAGLLKA